MGELALIGRAAETEIIDRLLGDALSGRSGVLVLTGDAGLAFSAVSIILHVAIGQRWPLSPTITDEDGQQEATRARATR